MTQFYNLYAIISVSNSSFLHASLEQGALR